MAAANTSEGLHLYFDAIRTVDKTANDDSRTIETLVEFTKLSATQNRTADQNQRFIELANQLDAREPKVQVVEEVFGFNIPEHSLETWIHHLKTTRGIDAEVDVHYKEENNCVYANINRESWTVDADEAGYAAADEAAWIRFQEIETARRQRDHWDNIPADQRQGVRPVLPAELTDAELARLSVNAERRARHTNRIAKNHEKNWVLLKRKLPNDTRLEDMLLRYTDVQRKKPDWNAVVLNLKQHGESCGYDTKHFKQALDRWISFFLSNLQKVTEKLPPDDVAKLLMNMHKPKSKFDQLQKELSDLVRLPEDDLESKLALLKSLATSMYADFPDSERISNVERILINGILQFTTGPVRRNAELAIEFEKRQGRRLNFEGILLGAINSERVYGSPKVPMPYNQPLKPVTMVYNVVTSPNDKVHGLDQLVHNRIDYGSMVYPPQNPNYDYSPRAEPRNVPFDPNVHPVANPAAGGAIPRIVIDRPEPNPQPENPITRDIPRPAVKNEVRPIHVPAEMKYSDPTRSSYRGTVISSGSSSSNDTLANDLSNMSIDDGAFHDASSHPTPQPELRHSTRTRSAPDRFQAGLNYVETNNLVPLVAEIVDNYFIKANRPQFTSKNMKDLKYGAGKYNVSNFTPQEKEELRQDSRRDRSRSRERSYSRGRSSDRNDRRRSSRNRDNSPRYRRSSSRNYRSSSNRRPRSSDGRRPRSYSRGKSPNRYSRGRSPRRSSRNRSGSPVNRGRSLSRNRRWNDKDMIKGVNCHQDYDPRKEFRCLKCMSENDHHEFYCKKYYRRGKFPCKTCSRGMHYADECDYKRSPSRTIKN